MKTDNAFIERYTPMVRMEVNRLGHEHLRDDLMQEGYYALIQSGRYYTETCGESFETYAARWIRRVVKQAIRRYGYPVSLPKHTKVEEGSFLSMDVAMEDNEGNHLSIEITHNETVETILVDKELHEALEQALRTLSQREQCILRQYYGIGCEPMKSAEIGQQMGMTIKIVHQMRARALKKMHKKCRWIEDFWSI